MCLLSEVNSYKGKTMCASASYLLAALCVLYASNSGTHAARILLIPANHHPEVNLFAMAARALTKAGHNTTVLSRDTHAKLLKARGVNTILHHVSSDRFVPEPSDVTKLLEEESFIKFAIGGFKFATAFNNLCREYLESEAILEKLKNVNFDLAIINGLLLTRCNFVIPYKYSIPFITLSNMLEPWQVRVGAIPSVEPMYGMVRTTNRMNLLHRLVNFLTYTVITSVMPYAVISDDLIQEYCPEKPQISLHELYRQSGIWLLNHDIYCMDYPRVSAPNYHFLGNLATEPAKPLPTDLEEYIADSKGLVVVSFGSAIGKLPMPIIHKLLQTFKIRPEKFVMRFSGEEQPENVPSNVKLLKWLPQNDLLGHKKTVLFITHGGHNGQLEGHYHAVPMIVMPVFGDQIYNGIRVEAKGHGKHLDLYTSTAEEVLEAITEVIGNPVYKQTLLKCRQIANELNSPEETLVFWVNHILQHGAEHLKGHGHELNLFQFLMLDVYLILLVVLVVLLGCCAFCGRCCWRCCCRRSRKDKVE